MGLFAGPRATVVVSEDGVFQHLTVNVVDSELDNIKEARI
jgi:hypothetical protein